MKLNTTPYPPSNFSFSSYSPPLWLKGNKHPYFGLYLSRLWFFLKINLFILFIYFWLRWVFGAACGLSLVAASGGYSSLQYAGFSLRWLLLLWSTGSRHAGFSSCSMQAQQLWRMGLVAPWHVGSSRTRARTRVPCIDRRILNNCATREA